MTILNPYGTSTTKGYLFVKFQVLKTVKTCKRSEGLPNGKENAKKKK